LYITNEGRAEKDMIRLVIAVIAVLAVSLVVPMSFARDHTPEERGKAHFENPDFAGGKMACSMCHVNGAMLEKAATKKKFRVAGKVQHSLEEAVNACIVAANKGKPIPVDSDEMEEMVAYIKSLKR
jgi:cytochrome c